MRQIILDTETTGIDPQAGHRIIEIGCVELLNRRLTGNHLHLYINPERKSDAGALAVHGITDEFLADKPTFIQIANSFLEFVQGAELIIHNAAFDVGFLNHELLLTKENYGLITDYCSIFDTLLLARQLHAGQKNSLDALCKRYNVDNSQRQLHGALLDAELLAHVYLAMTGGQVQLFAQENSVLSPAKQQSANRMAAKQQWSSEIQQLLLSKVTPEELLDHQQYLEELHKKSDSGCLWLNIANAEKI